MRRAFATLLLTAAILALGGCAGSVKAWIVRTRDHQGDRAIAQGNLKEAALAYRLALQVEPQDAHARDGAVSVQLALAQTAYRNARLEDAINELSIASTIDPTNPNVADLREQLSEARLKREIVLSNYPTYKATEQELVAAYARLRVIDQAIITNLKRFAYTYDTLDIAKAIESSSQLGAEVSRNTARLIAFRQGVETGAAGETRDQTSAPESLLPLP